jgi:mannose-6-phosphate isomerase-like protein (cupin superfamily)
MIIIHADQVKPWWSPPPHHRELKVLLSPVLQDVSNDLAIGMVTLPPGESGDPHTHHDSQECWYVISGKGKLKVGDEVAELVPDSVIVAPRGVEHQILNDGEEPLKALFFFSPAGPEEAVLPR